jgi:hypothetical protein
LEAGRIDPEEIRRLVGAAKDQGLIRLASSRLAPAPIDKSGEDVAATAAGVRSVWMDIDPATAETWLENNFVNRKLSDDTVRSYARDMLNGVWVATHQGVAFNDRDHLIDGQHRLSAIVLCGLTMRMMVTFGLPSKIAGHSMTTMDAVDRGKTRSVADQLKIQHGMKNGCAIAMICASIAGICQHERTRRLSVGQTLDIYREFQNPIDWAIDFKPSTPGLKAKGVLAACAFAVAADASLKSPCHELFTGSFSIAAGAPLQLLRTFLVSDDAKLLNRGTDRGLAELTLLALHLHVTGASPARLELSTAGLDAFRALQPARVAMVADLFKLPH